MLFVYSTLHGKLYFLFPDALKDRLSKEIALEYDLSCIIRKEDFFFHENMILPLGRKMKDDQKNSQKIHGNMIFSAYACGHYKLDITLPAKNNQRRSSPAKVHPKVTDNNSPYFNGGLYRRFHMLLSSGKIQET